MKVVFDFDDVLFNARAFKELMFFYLGERGIRNAKEIYEATRNKGRAFSIALYLAALGIKEEEVQEVYEGIMTPCEWLINKDMFRILQSLEIGDRFVLSQGEETFQRDKIERALGDHVVGSHIIIVPDSKTEELKRICNQYKNEDIIFVDDKLAFLHGLPVSELPNLKTVLFNEYGLQTLQAEIEESKKIEKEKFSPNQHNGNPKIR